MKVSVLLTSYNYGRYVTMALESALRQDHEGEIEIIAVDDGSTDDSCERLRSYSDRITLILQENAGQNAALSAGFAHSSGELVFFLDSDDEWEPQRISAAVKCFRENPDLGLVYNKMTLIGQDGRYVDHSGRVSDHPIHIGGGRRVKGDLRRKLRWQGLRYIFSPSSGLAFSRRALTSVMPLPSRWKIYSDAFAALPVALLFPVRHMDIALSKYRIHGSNAFNTKALPLAGRDRDLAYLDAYYVHVNEVLQRNGQEPLLPGAGWTYIKCLSRLRGKRPVHYLPQAFTAISRSRALSVGEKFKAMAWVGARAVERSL